MPSLSSVEKMVIVNFKDGRLSKGYFNLAGYPDLAALLNNSEHGFPRIITIFSVTDRSPVQIALNEVKAIFFVKSFDGDKDRKDIHFYAYGPEVGDVWVEIHFKDHEIMEGTLSNSIHHLVDPGFFLNPSDPGSNNQLAYINKDAILSYRVLGVRTVAATRGRSPEPVTKSR